MSEPNIPFVRVEHIYWEHYYPFAQLQKLDCVPYAIEGKGQGKQAKETFRVFQKLYPALCELKNWPAQNVLHCTPDQRRLLVFDVDIRDFRKNDKGGLLSGCQHAERDVCENCWQVLEEADQVLTTFMTDRLGQNTRPLKIFSGGNGMHFWYSVKNGAFYEKRDRLTFWDALNEFCVECSLQFSVFCPYFDEKVLLGEPNTHKIKAPFSLYRHPISKELGYQVALPLPDSKWETLLKVRRIVTDKKLALQDPEAVRLFNEAKDEFEKWVNIVCNK